MSCLYEVVVYTASLSKYADPLLDTLDKLRIMPHRLFREACIQYNGSYVKDLRRLGRNIKDIIIVDNSPVSFSLQPENALPIKSWFDDMNDRELFDLAIILEEINKFDDVREILGKVAASELCSKPNTNNLPYVAEVVQRCKLELARKKLIQAQEKLIKNTNENNDFNKINSYNASKNDSRKSTPVRVVTASSKVNNVDIDNDEIKNSQSYDINKNNISKNAKQVIDKNMAVLQN